MYIYIYIYRYIDIRPQPAPDAPRPEAGHEGHEPHGPTKVIIIMIIISIIVIVHILLLLIIIIYNIVNHRQHRARTHTSPSLPFSLPLSVSLPPYPLSLASLAPSIPDVFELDVQHRGMDRRDHPKSPDSYFLTWASRVRRTVRFCTRI